MFDWIKRLIPFKVKPTFNPTTPITPTVQEDVRAYEAVKRTRTAFKQQEQAMKARSLKPHSAVCKDPLECMKEKCFVWEPDKIVKEEVISADHYNKQRKKNIARLKDMKEQHAEQRRRVSKRNMEK